MPELPEVETTCRGITPHILAKTIATVVLRHYQLRYPLSRDLHLLAGQRFKTVTRRGKYLLFTTENNDQVLMHLGMSGNLRCVTAQTPLQKHDHLDIVFSDHTILRYHDPRRFGLWLWLGQTSAALHPLLVKLGPEPLSPAFDGAYLMTVLATKTRSIKQCLMNSHCVVGVGNIYANEALFLALIQPQRQACTISLIEARRLVKQIKSVLQQAIVAGGTTLKDFLQSDGQPGYFAQALSVYGRGGQACYRCQSLLQETRLDNRSTVYCPQCQR